MKSKNFIIKPVRNYLHFTKDALRNALAQDISNIQDIIINNGSTDGTAQWLWTLPRSVQTITMNGPSVAAAWNKALQYVFDNNGKHALVINNDVRLRPDTYRLLLEDGGDFVTAVGVQGTSTWKPGVSSWPPQNGLPVGDGGASQFPGGKPDIAKTRPHP